MFYVSEKMEQEIGTIDVVDELVSFSWTLDWAACRAKKCGESVLSPAFSTLTDDDKVLGWRLQLYPDGVNRKCRGSMSLYLRTVEEKKRGLLQKVVFFFLLNRRGEQLNRTHGELYSQFKRDTCGLDQFIRRDLFDSNAVDLLNYDKLTLVCTIADKRTEHKFHPGHSAKSASVMPPRPLPRTRSLGDLLQDDVSDREEAGEQRRGPPSDPFEAMLECGRSDVSVVVGRRSFCAHRAILAARSAHFRAGFEQDLAQGKRLSLVDMGEFAADVVVEVLRYLYLDTVDRLAERASQLLAPAHKYRLERLKAQCEEAMIAELSVANASEYLVLAFLHEAAGLRERAMDFVVAHSLDVVSTPGFKLIAGSHANVIAAILKTITTKSKK